VSVAASRTGAEAVGSEPMSQASTLCVGCGLCCNGVLFTNARAEPGEVPRMRELGLEVEKVGERLQFRQPCPQHHDGQCGIYSDRFLKCRTFRCALLKRLDSGETTLADAQAIVGQARAMLGRVAGLDPAAAQYRVRAEQRASAPAVGNSEESVLRRRLLIEGLALDLFFDRKFRNKKAVAMEPARKPDGR
jgi:hypothetical protein